VTVREKSPDKHWCRPPQGFVKLTVDGSFHATDGSAGAGMALRDDQGIVIFTACRFMNNCSGPLEAEILACLEGLELALIRCQLRIIVEIDCSQLVVAAKASSQDRPPLVHLISDLRVLFSHERVSDIVKVERSHFSS
jgi:hypothetical protein